MTFVRNHDMGLASVNPLATDGISRNLFPLHLILLLLTPCLTDEFFPLRAFDTVQESRQTLPLACKRNYLLYDYCNALTI
jgi:hypothetical protein